MMWEHKACDKCGWWMRSTTGGWACPNPDCLFKPTNSPDEAKASPSPSLPPVDELEALADQECTCTVHDGLHDCPSCEARQAINAAADDRREALRTIKRKVPPKSESPSSPEASEGVPLDPESYRCQTEGCKANAWTPTKDRGWICHYCRKPGWAGEVESLRARLERAEEDSQLNMEIAKGEIAARQKAEADLAAARARIVELEGKA